MKYRNRFGFYKREAMKKLGISGWIKMPKKDKIS